MILIERSYQVGAIMFYTLWEGFKCIRFCAHCMPGSSHLCKKSCCAINTIFAYISMLRSRTHGASLIQKHIKQLIPLQNNE